MSRFLEFLAGLLLGGFLAMSSTHSSEPVVARFGAKHVLPDHERFHYSRAVNFAPVNGETVSLNPPRFRWTYNPETPGKGGDYLFTFQISGDPDFDHSIVGLETPFNFYNAISPFDGTGPFYWRVGYRERGEEKPGQWSAVRHFFIAPEAQVWDRSMMAEPGFKNRPHPRILFNRRTLPRLQRLVQEDADSTAIFDGMRREADRVVSSDWWNRVPDSDRREGPQKYLTMARQLVLVGFVWRVSGDAKYAGVKERAVKMARYPRGGRASPEGAGGESSEDSTQITEFLALLYDWLWVDLSDEEKSDFVKCLEWRIDFFLNEFSWKIRRNDREYVHGSSIAVAAASHGYEGFFDTFPAALAIYEDSEVAKTCFHLGVNYMIGIGSGHGFDEGWNEGPGYGNSKWAWYVNAVTYLDSVFPEFQMGRNTWLSRLGEFFRLQTPVGLRHAPWGHGSNRRGYYENGHRRSYRKLAFLTGDGRFLANWYQYGSIEKGVSRPWIECSLPLWRKRPEPLFQEDHVAAFPISGWVMAMSGPPSNPDTYNKGVGMIFCCRPRGAYSHSFNSDNSFHIFGYGQDLSHAAGSGDYEPHAFHSMSHNTILVDGLGQAQPRIGQIAPFYGRIMAFGESGELAAYWCGDATQAYPQEPLEVRHWWGRMSNIYRNRALPHLRRVNRHVLFVHRKYFVILDDLAASEPARWTWLYHVLKSDSMKLDERTGSFHYGIGDVDVHVVHLLGKGALDVSNRRNADGFRNPLTNEDYWRDRGRARGERRIVAEDNLWLTTRDGHERWRFLCVVYPVPPGGSEPVIKRLDGLTIRIEADGKADTVSFSAGASETANIVVDLDGIAPAGLH